MFDLSYQTNEGSFKENTDNALHYEMFAFKNALNIYTNH